MGVVGADIAAIRNFALGLRKRSTEVAATTARLSTLVDQIPWVGADRERFLNDWHGTHRPRLEMLIEELVQAARDAVRHADEQEAASAAKGDGS